MNSNDVHTVENFYGVYLLYCKNPKFLGRTYIGFTVDPNRRIKQHNRGKNHGGAWKTSNRGPWAMVLIIHGFPNDIAALRFEWAWQHPHVSRRLNHLPKRKTRERTYDYCIRVLSEMLSTGPWNRLPLTIRWLEQEFAKDFSGSPEKKMAFDKGFMKMKAPPGTCGCVQDTKVPPIHMPICYGPVVSKKIPKPQSAEDQFPQFSDLQLEYCYICNNPICDKGLSCLNTKCDLISHVICLSKHYLNAGEYVPVEGVCPKCKETFLWGDIIRKYKGCYGTLDLTMNVNGDDFYSSDSE